MREKDQNKNNRLSETLDKLVEMSSYGRSPKFRDLAKAAGLDPRFDFRNSNLANIDFRDEDLTGFDFSGADLTASDFRRAKLAGAVFHGCNLTGVIGLSHLPPEHSLSAKAEALLAQQIKKKIVSGDTFNTDEAYFVRILRLGNSGVKHIQEIRKVKYLRELSIMNTKVSDISALAELHDLKNLYLDDSSVADLTPLALLNNLKILSIRNIPVSDISPLRNITNLEALFINLRELRHLKPLSNMKKLSNLQIIALNLTDITGLEHLSNLKRLVLRASKVKDVDLLGNLINLKSLSLTSANRSIDFISRMQDLESLSVGGAGISRLNSIPKNLKYLHLNITNDFKSSNGELLAPLDNLILTNPTIQLFKQLSGNNFDMLILSGRGVTEEFLRFIPKSVTRLTLENTSISDVSALRKLNSIEYLSLSGSPVEDISPLMELEKLSQISLYRTSVGEADLSKIQRKITVTYPSGKYRAATP